MGDRPSTDEATAPTVLSKPNRTVDDTGELAPVRKTIDDTGDDGTTPPPRDPALALTAVAEDAPPARRGIGDLPTTSRELYAIEAEHARGGLGVILRAEDRRLERTVAIKELASNASDRAGTRFLREALITARLQHPGIVPVYEAGRWPDGSPYYAMKLVSGKTLREEVKSRKKLEDRLALLPRVLAVAEAVAYAHANGVIHRDLKPDNVLIGKYGETIVVDWGLAKDRRQTTDELRDAGLYARAHADGTRIGAILGTPAYMAPEQARGEDVDERADVWALGAILYYVLAAAPPFEGSPEVVISRVAEEPPPALATRATGAPRDLLAIVDKAMSRDPLRRYPDAKELADDLSRFLTGQLVGAREYGRLARIEHWVRQNSAPVAVAAILLVVLAAFATYSIRKILDERSVARARGDELVLTQASSQLDRDPTAAIAWLKQYPNNGADWESVRTIAADAYSRGIARHVWGGHPEAVMAIAISRDGHLAATASRGVLQFHDPISGVVRGRLENAEALALQFLPGGGLAAGLQDGTVILVDPVTLARRVLGHSGSQVVFLGVDPQGRWIVTGDYGGSVRLWPLDGAPSRELVHHRGAVYLLEVVERGAAVVSFGGDDNELIRTPLDGQPALLIAITPTLNPQQINSFALGRDGKTLALGYGEQVLGWDVGAPKPVELGRHRNTVSALVATNTGEVDSGAVDGTLLRMRPGEAPQPLTGHLHPIAAIAVGVGGELVSGDAGGDVRVWTPTEHAVLRGHFGKIHTIVFGPERSILTTSDDSTVRVWPARRPSRVIAFAPDHSVFKLAFVAPMSLAAVGQDGGVHLVPLDGTPRDLPPHKLQAYGVVRIPGVGFATSSWDGALRVFRLDGTLVHELNHGALIWNIAASYDGKQLATAGADGIVKLWNVATGAARIVDKRVGRADDVVFSPDAHVLAASGADFEIHIYDLVGGGAPRVLRGHTGDPLALTFSRDGSRLYSAGLDGSVRGWNVETGASQVFAGHEGQVRTIALSPDGRFLASGGADGLVIVWNLMTNDKLVFRGHTAEVRHVAFSPDSRRVASAGWDGSVRLWDLADGRVTIWRGHTDQKVHRVEFSPDGKLVASGGGDGTVRLWSVEDEDLIPGLHDELQQWIGTATTAMIGNRASTIQAQSVATP